MKCIFCQIKLDDPTCRWLQFEVVSDFTCTKCDTSFTQHVRSNKITEYIMCVGYYRLIFNLNRKIFVIGYNDNDSTANVYKTILKLDYLPDHITPDNVKDKLKMLLTFS